MALPSILPSRVRYMPKYALESHAYYKFSLIPAVGAVERIQYINYAYKTVAA